MEQNVKNSRERAILVGLELTGDDPEQSLYSLEELAQLADTAGAEVLAQVVQKRPRPDAATFLGKGKVEELAGLCRESGADLVIINRGETEQDHLADVRIDAPAGKVMTKIVNRLKTDPLKGARG